MPFTTKILPKSLFLRISLSILVLHASFSYVSANPLLLLFVLPELADLLVLGGLSVAVVSVNAAVQDNHYIINNSFDAKSSPVGGCTPSYYNNCIGQPIAPSGSTHRITVLSKSQGLESQLSDRGQFLGNVNVSFLDSNDVLQTLPLDLKPTISLSGSNFTAGDGFWDPLPSSPYSPANRMIPYIGTALNFTNFQYSYKDAFFDRNILFPFADSLSMQHKDRFSDNNLVNQRLKLLDLRSRSFFAQYSNLTNYSIRSAPDGEVLYNFRDGAYSAPLFDEILSDVGSSGYSLLENVVSYYNSDSTIDIDVKFSGPTVYADQSYNRTLDSAAFFSTLDFSSTPIQSVYPPDGAKIRIGGSIGIPITSKFTRNVDQTQLASLLAQTAIKDHSVSFSGYVSGYFIVGGHMNLTGTLSPSQTQINFDQSGTFSSSSANIDQIPLYLAPRNILDWFARADKSYLKYDFQSDNKIIGFVGSIYLDNIASTIDIPFNSVGGTMFKRIPFVKLDQSIPIVNDITQESGMVDLINSRIDKWLDSWSGLTSISVPWKEPPPITKPWDEPLAADSGMDRTLGTNKPVFWVVSPAEALQKMFIPTKSVKDRYNDFLSNLSLKWPFNIAAQLHTFDDPGSSVIDLPKINLPYGLQIGLPAGSLAPMLSTIRAATTSALTWWFSRFLLFKLRPKPQI
jgi:hypothetical protein